MASPSPGVVVYAIGPCWRVRGPVSDASSWTSRACIEGVEIRIVGVEQEVAADVRLRELLIDAIVAEVELHVTRSLGHELVVA